MEAFLFKLEGDGEYGVELEILEAGDDILGTGDLTGDVIGGIIW